MSTESSSSFVHCMCTSASCNATPDVQVCRHGWTRSSCPKACGGLWLLSPWAVKSSRAPSEVCLCSVGPQRRRSVVPIAGHQHFRHAGKVHRANTLEQLKLVGPSSLGVSLLTASFVGMVFTIQVLACTITSTSDLTGTSRTCCPDCIGCAAPPACSSMGAGAAHGVADA